MEDTTRIATGEQLLKTSYKDNLDDFLRAIKRGAIIPVDIEDDDVTDHGGRSRLMPEKLGPLRIKKFQIERLKEHLAKTDDENLRNNFNLIHHGWDKDKDFERFRVEEGPALLEKLAQSRVEREEELKKLLAEVGDLDKALLPSEVWSDVIFSIAEQKTLLKAKYLVTTSDN